MRLSALLTSAAVMMTNNSSSSSSNVVMVMVMVMVSCLGFAAAVKKDSHSRGKHNNETNRGVCLYASLSV